MAAAFRSFGPAVPLAAFAPVSSALRHVHPPLLSRLLRRRPVSLPAPAVAAIAGVSGLLASVWESILRAVPKKKTSHMKKRHRQMAGKALKDVTEIVKCPGCGRPKRAHILCPYCIQSVRHWLKGNENHVAED